MRKNLLVLFVLFCFADFAAWSQAAAPPKPPVSLPGADTPKDPAALMKAAAEVNGLDDAKLAPWHLKASFQLYDFNGKPTEQGTYEEFWDGPKKYKRIYTSPTFTQTEWLTEGGDFFEGQPGRPPIVLQTLRTMLVSPIPSQRAQAQVTLALHEQPRGGVKLPCVSLLNEVRGLSSPPPELFPTYCFANVRPILRMGTNFGGTNYVANEIVLFQNRYVPKLVQINHYQTPWFTIHVEQLEGLSPAGRAALEPPPAAQKTAEIQMVERLLDVIKGGLVKKVPPAYPADAKLRRVQGIVAIRATIGTDGHIGDISLVSAPDALLAEAAAYAVKQWEYTPYLLNGVPVEVETQINVVFKLGN